MNGLSPPAEVGNLSPYLVGVQSCHSERAFFASEESLPTT